MKLPTRLRRRSSTPAADPGVSDKAADERPDIGRAKLRVSDAVGTSTLGLRNRRSRTMLTALGIGVGIASLVAVVGVSSSSRADLLSELDALGTNLIVVQPGQSFSGGSVKIPRSAPAMVRRIGPVINAAGLAKIDTSIHRNEWAKDENAVTVVAAEPTLVDTINGSLARGRFLDEGTSTLPVVVLGTLAADRLGITTLEGAPSLVIAGRRFAVIGVLDPLPLHPDLDRTAFIGMPAATDVLGAKIVPSIIYARVDPAQVKSVVAVLPSTVSPAAPEEVSASFPSDTLKARAQVDANLRNLLMGLGAVALLVGAIGIANVMVVSVLERRGEIGLRRALGATRFHILVQFVLESMALATIGGVFGVVLGVLATALYARQQEWSLSIPTTMLLGAVGIALVMGALAGMYPAIRAARLDPAEAVRPH